MIRLMKLTRRAVALALLSLMCVLTSHAQMPIYGDYFAHDPGTMIKDGSRYYIFYTGFAVPYKYSTDLRTWTWNSSQRVFPSGPPAWVTNTWPALTSVSTAWSFIGRSLYSADGWLNATIDEIRIYDGRLTPEEIAVNYQFGPNALALPVTLVQTNNPTTVTLSWPSWAVGFNAEASTNLTSGSWSAVTPNPTLASDRWSVTVSMTNNLKLFRLKR